MFTFLKNLRGNARGCVFSEPLWGIPFNLYAPYIAVYQRELGLKDSQIGLVISVGMLFQIFSALLSGAITDKLGRRRTTYIFDLLSWSVPALIWAVSQNFYFFVGAAIINSLWRITMTSWTCLMVEDTDPDQLVEIYSWIYISGLLVGFFAPVAGLLINAFSLVPTVRGLYVFAAGMFTLKFVLTNAWTTETRQGLVRMQETKNQPLLSMLGEYRGVLKQILRTPETLYTLGIMLIMNICLTVNNTFWSLLVTEKINIPAGHISIYPSVKSITMLLFFFFIMPRIRSLPYKVPMIVGFGIFVLSQVVLISVPEKSYLLLLLSTLLDACALASVSPQVDRMLVLTVEPKERARIMSILYVVMLTIASPFGWIAGRLSEANRILPFMMNMAFFAVGALLVYLAARAAQKVEPVEVAGAST